MAWAIAGEQLSHTIVPHSALPPLSSTNKGERTSKSHDCPFSSADGSNKRGRDKYLFIESRGKKMKISDSRPARISLKIPEVMFGKVPNVLSSGVPRTLQEVHKSLSR